RPQGASQAEPEGRLIRNAERKALTALNLDIHATAAEIKARFKELAKRLHPDANGGDRSREDKLREIIQAYNYLKS
ncbi:DnaJ domain-containing protein, partial [Klebsiella pneumoniae]|uniref:DnaJ domain-containing protein n=1 Tax=Klebsiella pneumoniae TaxID=573 RepID=UPI0013D10F96